MSTRAKAATLDFYGIPHGLKPRAPQVRQDNPLNESHVIREVSELLAVHPRVLVCWRQNSGGASYEHSSGRHAPIYFYKILTGQPVTIPDFFGLLRDGRPFTLEGKRRDWRGPRDEREKRQALFISLIQNIGGVGAFVKSAEEANEALKG